MNKKIYILTILFILCAACAYGSGYRITNADSSVLETQIVLPSSYMEYCSLNSPVDQFFDGVNFAVAENKRIAVYSSNVWSYYELNDYSVSKIALYEGFCLFMSSSELFYFSLNDGVIKKADVILSSYFYINGNTLVTAPSTSVYIYKVKVENGELVFAEPTFYNGLSFSADKFVVDDNGAFYYFLEQKVFAFDYLARTSSELGKNLPFMPRYTTMNNGIIYYSTETGIYAFDVEKGVNELLVSVSSGAALPSITNPQGVFYHNGELLVSDSTLNSVFCLNLNSDKFTEFAVTARSDMAGRINNANDIAAYGDSVFILENNGITVYNTVNGTNYQYSLSDFSGAKFLAVTEKYMFLSQGAQLYVVSYDGEKLTYVTLNNSVDIDDYKNIVAVISYEEDFYFIDNRSRNSQMTACIFKLSTLDMTITEIGSLSGAGLRLCSDIFGKIYIAVNSGTEYNYYSFVPTDFNGTLSASPLFTTAEKPLSMFVDIEDKVYVLFDNMLINCYEQSFTPPYDFNLKSDYAIRLSGNLPQSATVKLAELIPATDKVYLLTDNLLLKAASEMGISTPDRLKVPENLKIELNKDPEFIEVDRAAKIFKINIEQLTDEFFDYIEYTTEISGDQYIVLNRSERYSLIFNMNTCALVRNGDVQTITPETDNAQDAFYMVDDYGIYAYPATLNLFKISSLTKNTKVNLVKTIKFNNVEYSYISFENGEGYVPKTLLKPAIATDNTPTDYYTVKTAKGGAKVYSDKSLSEEIGFIEGETVVTAVESDGNVTKIYFENGYGYISDSDLQSSTFYSVRNIIVIVCLIIGVLATAVFLFKKGVDKKEQ